ncbi:syntaxin-16 [Ochlerotatus camptorhynchus]|uniref:syntaxin-16 n=1 Tax=Ochlerotatus camptorhynchus TaxID=644619 RepID=UPI0031E129D4
MSHRNLTELFFMLRNNILYNKNVYSDTKNSDNIALLDRGCSESSNNVEQPKWMGKYDEIHYFLTKLKTKIDYLLQIQGSSVRSVLSENSENELKVQECAKDISKLIATCHSNIKVLKLSTRSQNRLESILLQNVERKLLISLQYATERFQRSQTAYMDEQNNMEQKSKVFFENISTNVDSIGNNSVDTFDNFLNMNVSLSSSKGNPYDNDDEKLDDYFQLPASGMSINQKQLMLIEAGNTKMIQSREQEVSKIVNSIVDLNTVFKDLSHLVQEQGTILDRIDYNIESTQTKVFEGYKQLQKAEKYQRKNKKMYCILILASMIMFMIILTIFTNF